MNSTQLAEDYYKSIEENIHTDVRILNEVIKSQNEEMEGNCFYHGAKVGEEFLTSWFLKYKRINLAFVIKNRKCKKIAEIGFNGGHSAAVFLNALDKSGEMIVFDLCDHKYTVPCANYLVQVHPQLKSMFVGDSRITLKNYVETKPEEKGTFDLIHVDGGHSEDILESDLYFSDLLLKSGGILILDDTQIKEMQKFVPILLDKNYTFLFQIPTFGFMHAFFEKS